VFADRVYRQDGLIGSVQPDPTQQLRDVVFEFVVLVSLDGHRDVRRQVDLARRQDGAGGR
jgi:hypothetical protein